MSGRTPATQPKFFSPSSPFFTLFFLCIPRPARLLFQHDDGWDRSFEKNGHQFSDSTKISVEQMLAFGT